MVGQPQGDASTFCAYTVGGFRTSIHRIDADGWLSGSRPTSRKNRGEDAHHDQARLLGVDVTEGWGG